MFVDQQLEDLELRKRALIARSDVQRAMLQVECIRLRPYLEYVDAGAKMVKKVRPIWLAGASVLGLLVARRVKKLATVVPTALLAWKVIKKGLAMWRESSRPGDAPATPAAPDEV